MAITRTLPEKDNLTEGYEEPFNRNSDAVDVRGVYIQNDTSNDTSVVVTRDASDNLSFTDPVTGTKTLAQLAAGAGSGFTAKAVSTNTTIPAGNTWFQHDIAINNGITLFIADGGELLLL